MRRWEFPGREFENGASANNKIKKIARRRKLTFIKTPVWIKHLPTVTENRYSSKIFRSMTLGEYRNAGR